jgi:hypothetical protein
MGPFLLPGNRGKKKVGGESIYTNSLANIASELNLGFQRICQEESIRKQKEKKRHY